MVNDEKELVGVISLDDIRDIIFNTELYEKVKISEIMQTPRPSSTRARKNGKSAGDLRGNRRLEPAGD